MSNPASDVISGPFVIEMNSALVSSWGSMKAKVIFDNFEALRKKRDSPHSPSQSPRRHSRSRSRARSRSRSQDLGDASNPGNNLYVTGLSTRVTTSDLEKYFNNEGKVVECNLVTDPRTRESRGFAFVTMETAEDANRCIKYLNRSVLEGRLITVEKAKRKRGRTPTPGKYHGLRDKKGRDRRSASYSPQPRHGRGRSPRSRARRSRSTSPYGRRDDSIHRRYRDRS